MSTWKTRGLRGSTLEDMVNKTNDRYLEAGLCLVQKIPTPITPIKIDSANKHITLAYFDQKSTVDYIGAAQGIPIAFDAKECNKDTFALANIHEHQVTFMENFEKQGGIAFFLIHYTNKDKYYYLRFQKLKEFWDRMKNGGRKSFTFDEIETEFILKNKPGILVPYLDGINMDLSVRDDNS